jgi:hypothetical protein
MELQIRPYQGDFAATEAKLNGFVRKFMLEGKSRLAGRIWTKGENSSQPEKSRPAWKI